VGTSLICGARDMQLVSRMSTSRISPCFVFPENAREAVTFYVSVFPDSKIIKTTTYKEGEPGPEGQIRTISFELMGQHMVATNAKGDNFSFGQGLSLMMECDDQKMIDSITRKLIDGGAKQQDCGWVVDRFGVSWQIVPKMVREVIEGKDDAKADRVIHALFQMKKLDIAQLERAANGN
jgi:predicted 3-demethylubiquinone-9 3-methyltransferase (glyoxalase superfamily)